MTIPNRPKIYHITHFNNLRSILDEGNLLCDAEIQRRYFSRTVIGMNHIKKRRLGQTLNSHPGLHVGDCVPFYFCPRSVMLYLIDKKNPELAYKEGQTPIVHLEADFYTVVSVMGNRKQRWAFTTSNAGSCYFDDYADTKELHRIHWNAIHARSWRTCKEEKQAEFLVEKNFPWALIERIGVYNDFVFNEVSRVLQGTEHKPRVEKIPAWYY